MPRDQLAGLVEVETEIGFTNFAQVVVEAKSVQADRRITTAADEDAEVGESALEHVLQISGGFR